MTFTNGREQPAIAYLNEVSEDYETASYDAYTAALLASLPSPPPIRPPATSPAKADDGSPSARVPMGAGSQAEVLGQDRAAAALLLRWLRGAP